jgi:alanine racemase
MDRGYIYVNKKSFINNLQYLSQISKKKTCLVVKANAYGHGIKWSVRNAREADVEWFAVASIDEGIQVKQEFKESRVLLLAEPSVGQLDNILKNDLDLTVYSDSFIDALIDTGNQYNVHLKIDTGMHRIGCSPDKFDYFLKKLMIRI